MVDNKNKTDWQPAVEIFSQVSTWIIVPIVLALIFGKMLDKHYGTAPVIFLVLAGIGFLFSCYGIVKIVKKYMEEIKNLGEENKKKDLAPPVDELQPREK